MNTIPLHNWAESFSYSFKHCAFPQSLEDVQEIVAKSPALKAVGSRHSFNLIADGSAAIVLQNVPISPVVEEDGKAVSIGAHATYGELCIFLKQHDLAIHNLASLPHISIAGAIATATHGSGDSNGNLATAVRAVEFVTADGSVIRSRRGDAEFPGLVVHLGALGVMTRVTLDVERAFDVFQYVYEDLRWNAFLQNFDAIMGLGYSVSVFTDWGEKAGSIWVKSRAGSYSSEYFGATAAPVKRHPILGLDPRNCTDQLGIPGTWYERLPHFKMGFTPSNGEEIQSEFHVPRHQAAAAIEALVSIRSTFAHLAQDGEFRTTAADDLWMSPQYRQDTASIHFTWVRDASAVDTAVKTIERVLEPFDARPHWGKVFHAPSLVGRYAKHNDFRALRDRMDPQRKFGNQWLIRAGL